MTFANVTYEREYLEILIWTVLVTRVALLSTESRDQALPLYTIPRITLILGHSTLSRSSLPYLGSCQGTLGPFLIQSNFSRLCRTLEEHRIGFFFPHVDRS
jgi:hypothetical protein